MNKRNFVIHLITIWILGYAFYGCSINNSKQEELLNLHNLIQPVSKKSIYQDDGINFNIHIPLKITH
jgi:hypothetical protein